MPSGQPEIQAIFGTQFHSSLSPVHTVAQKGDSRRKPRDNGEIFGDCRTFLRQCGQDYSLHHHHVSS